jgi:hypothetical protein
MVVDVKSVLSKNRGKKQKKAALLEQPFEVKTYLI